MQNNIWEFIREYEQKVIELNKEANLAYFKASISGKPEDYQEAANLQLKISKILADQDSFSKLKAFKQEGKIEDLELKRQLELIYNDFAGHQYNEELLESIITLSTKIEERFATFRTDV
ncbi:MAG: hypothetical protein ABIG69_14055, partial [Bacteroidota bacterium]